MYICKQDSLLRTSRTLCCKGSACSTSFPVLIHQTWKTDQLSSLQENLVASWKQHYPDYRHTLWTDYDMELYVASRFACSAKARVHAFSYRDLLCIPCFDMGQSPSPSCVIAVADFGECENLNLIANLLGWYRSHSQSWRHI